MIPLLFIYDDVPDTVVDTTYNYSFTTLFDSLMYWKNADCNNDGIRTEAEIFYDTGLDGCFDDNERGVFYNDDGSINSLKNSCGECDQAYHKTMLIKTVYVMMIQMAIIGMRLLLFLNDLKETVYTIIRKLLRIIFMIRN